MRVCILTFFLLTAAKAATIVGFGPVTGAATGGLGSLTTTAPNNDNVVGVSPNGLSFGLAVNSIGSISHPLLGDGLPGVSEYTLFVLIQNNLALPIVSWTFHLPGTPYDFDTPDLDAPVLSSLGWAPVQHTDAILKFQGGALAPGQSMTFQFNVDVPAGNLGFSSDFEVASVPEPSTWVLTMGALLVGAGRMRRRSKA